MAGDSLVERTRNWPAINPGIIAATARETHVRYLIEDAQRDIAAQAARIEALEANVDLKANFIEATLNQLAQADEDKDNLRATITTLGAQLKTVLDREAESHARHDAKLDALEAQLNDCRTMLLATGQAAADHAKRAAALEADVGRLREVMACQVNSHTNDCSCPVCVTLRNHP